MVFQNCCPKDPNKALLIPNLRILIFAENFPIRQFGGRWWAIWQQFFNIPAKDSNGDFLVPNLFIFSFWMKLCSFTNSSVLIKHLIIVFVKLQPKNTQVKCFWSTNLNIFYFLMKLCKLTNSRMLISNSTLVSWNPSPKYPIRTIFVPNLWCFIFGQKFIWKSLRVLMWKKHSIVDFSGSSLSGPTF